jgi:hypothetical protein
MSDDQTGNERGAVSGRRDEDTEGHRIKLIREDGEQAADEDTEGHRIKLIREDGEQAADDDVEGHRNMQGGGRS